MTTAYAQHFSTRQTPQSEPIPGTDQVANNAGGFSFPVDDWAQLNRFLVLGSAGGSWYVSEQKLTIENAQCVLRCLDADPGRTVRAIVEVSDAGRAPKNDPAIFALAIAAGHAKGKAHALAALPKVARIPTHLFQFIEAAEKMRGWGAGLRDAVGAWYQGRPAAQLAYHAVKYQSRGGWSHRDLLRLAHPRTPDPDRQAVYRWMVGGMAALGERTVKRGEAVTTYPDVSAELPAIIRAFEEAKTADESGIIRLIREHDLPRECVPTQHLHSAAVWEALLEKMPLHATVRNLGKMTAVGLLKPFSAAAKLVADRLGDRDYIRKSRLHPMAILVALKTYAQGRGDKGSLAWSPVSTVNDALDAAFDLAFENVEPAGKRTLIALDVSGSMGSPIAGSPLSCREASAAMAMVVARAEPQYQVMAFAHTLVPVDIAKTDRLADVVAKTGRLPFGGTDCALPMLFADRAGLDVDTFITMTDSETWHGAIHPAQALVQYRQRRGIAARSIVAGMVANAFTIADPADPLSLDVVGFSTDTPGVMTDFSAGRI